VATTRARNKKAKTKALDLLGARHVFLGGLSQNEVAERAGIHPSYLSRALLGKRRMSIDVMAAIAATMKISLDTLYARLRAVEAARAVARKNGGK
jgi:transcriptional regulator with XRE-family HTH domain